MPEALGVAAGHFWQAFVDAACRLQTSASAWRQQEAIWCKGHTFRIHGEHYDAAKGFTSLDLRRHFQGQLHRDQVVCVAFETQRACQHNAAAVPPSSTDADTGL